MWLLPLLPLLLTGGASAASCPQQQAIEFAEQLNARESSVFSFASAELTADGQLELSFQLHLPDGDFRPPFNVVAGLVADLQLSPVFLQADAAAVVRLNYNGSLPSPIPEHAHAVWFIQFLPGCAEIRRRLNGAMLQFAMDCYDAVDCFRSLPAAPEPHSHEHDEANCEAEVTITAAAASSSSLRALRAQWKDTFTHHHQHRPDARVVQAYAVYAGAVPRASLLDGSVPLRAADFDGAPSLVKWLLCDQAAGGCARTQLQLTLRDAVPPRPHSQQQPADQQQRWGVAVCAIYNVSHFGDAIVGRKQWAHVAHHSSNRTHIFVAQPTPPAQHTDRAAVVFAGFVLLAAVCVCLAALAWHYYSTRTLHGWLHGKYRLRNRAEAVHLGRRLGGGAWGDVHEATIGRGAFSRARRAELFGKAKKTEIQAAVKTLRAHRNDEKEKTDFVNEVRTALLLQHRFHSERLVNVLGIDLTVTPYILALEKCDGSLLHHLRASARPLPLLQSLDMMIKICEAMELLHSVVCLHRDLAARNVLLLNGKPKLADFGLARVVCKRRPFVDGDDCDAAGHVQWTDPSVWRDRRFGTASDVLVALVKWSAGVLFWEMLSGGAVPHETSLVQHRQQKPTAESDKTTLLRLYDTDDYNLPRPAHCPPMLYDVLLCCWRRQPDERPTFSELKKLLGRQQRKQHQLPQPAADNSTDDSSSSAANSRQQRRPPPVGGVVLEETDGASGYSLHNQSSSSSSSRPDPQYIQLDRLSPTGSRHGSDSGRGESADASSSNV